MPKPAPAGSSPLVMIGGILIALGAIAGGALAAMGMVVPGAGGGGGVLVLGIILLIVGLSSGKGAGAAAAAPATGPTKTAPTPATRTCPTCNRQLMPTMASCPFCAQKTAGAGGDTGQAVPAVAGGGAAAGGPAPAAGSAYLDVIDGTMKGQRLTLGQAPTTIGRAPDNSICIKDPSVSSHHARIDFYQGKYFISDLQSSNGTYVNNARVEQAQLKNQDLVALGSTRCIISCA
jgi:hypothetical protein